MQNVENKKLNLNLSYSKQKSQQKGFWHLKNHDFASKTYELVSNGYGERVPNDT